MIFFTSDTHLGHANIIAYCKRPILKEGDYIYHTEDRGEWSNYKIKNLRCKEHDEFIIDRWNSVVGKNDDVYHAGDFAFVRSVEELNEYISRLNGKIHLVMGNHDRYSLCSKATFAEITQKNQGLMINCGSCSIFINHMCCRVWDKSHYGYYHLYGHSHGTLPEDPNSLSFDCGVDTNNYYPYSLDEVIQRMKKKI